MDAAHPTGPAPAGGFPTVGVVGGGQLARMMQAPATALGLHLAVLAESPQAAAAQVVPDSPVGAADDLEAVRSLARRSAVLTFDHEHVPQPVLRALQDEGLAVAPGAHALEHAQDKLVMRRALGAAGLPCPAWAQARSAQEVRAFGDTHGWPVVVKTPRGGYDGKGVIRLRSGEELDDTGTGAGRTVSTWLDGVGRDGHATSDGVLVESAVPFTRELAVLVARSPSGQAAAWPVVETVQTDGICTEVIAPAPDLDPDLAARATQAGLRIAGDLGVVGVLAVELFEIDAAAPGGHPEGFVVNELAMRPHNSGHWSIDGAVTSQFEQHLRAVLDLPLGDPRPRTRWTVMANVLGGEYPDLYPAYRHLLARDPGLRVHLYGKDVRPGRKIGHVTVTGDDLAELRERARHAADYLEGTVTE